MSTTKIKKENIKPVNTRSSKRLSAPIAEIIPNDTEVISDAKPGRIEMAIDWAKENPKKVILFGAGAALIKPRLTLKLVKLALSAQGLTVLSKVMDKVYPQAVNK